MTNIGTTVSEVAVEFGWTEEVAEAKIKKTQEILGLDNFKDAVNFLLAKIENPIICDACNVQEPWEHRCHRTRSLVDGEQTNKQCQCPDCFVINELGIS